MEYATIKRAWDTQVIGGAKDATGPQVVHLGQRLRIQKNQKLGMSDHVSSKNKKTMSR